MHRNKIIFRADGNSRIGLGHVVRSLALAEMLREEFECVFAIQDPSEAVLNQLKSVCSEIIKLPETRHTEANFTTELLPFLNGKEIVVLDGYNFHTAYQQNVKDKCYKLVCIDDIHSYHFVADAIINHIAGIKPESYSVEPYTQFFLGFKYALLRKEFRLAAMKKNFTENLSQDAIFICLGGADPGNKTLEVLKTCMETKPASEYFIVIGSAFQHRKELTDFAEKQVAEITILSNITSADMVKYMQHCPTAIMSASSVSYEYLSAGNGILFLLKTADNQQEVFQYFIANLLALPFESFSENISGKIRKQLLQNGKVFDGNQQENLLSIFKNLSNAHV